MIAAAIESIDKVGPFQAKFLLVGIDDIRAIKKKIIVDRAKRIVQEWATKTISEGEEMLKDVYDASKPGKLTAFGKAQLACGTGVFDSDWIILVEGRADVINLLRAGFDNAIAIEGAKVDESIIKLTEGKRVVAFLDGDRAGDLILKELHGLVKIDKVLRAPNGREVEECTPLEIAEILREVLVIPLLHTILGLLRHNSHRIQNIIIESMKKNQKLALNPMKGELPGSLTTRERRFCKQNMTKRWY